MRVLYGVVGDGMGHATRSRVILEHLLDAGHEVRVAVSGRAHAFLTRVLAGRPGAEVVEIAGLRMVYGDNRVQKAATARTTLAEAPEGLRRNAGVFRRIAADLRPDVVVTDFDTFTYLVGRALGVPVVSIDNNHVIDRCRHERTLRAGAEVDHTLARAVVAARLPQAYHYLVTTFFFPPVAKRRTTLVPPILRPEILAARREPGGHVLVYQTAAGHGALVDALRRLPYEFRVYGAGREAREGNVHLRAFSEQTFVDDLRTARAAVAGGGFSFLSEAVHLRVPLLSIPLRGQYEQELNARYLERLGYGERAEEATSTAVAAFLERVEEHAAALARHTPRDNAFVLRCVDELLARAARGEPAPDVLDAALAGIP